MVGFTPGGHGPRGTVLAALLLVGATSSALPLVAQTIRGAVVDSLRSTPVKLATVDLLQSDGGVTAREFTDDRGRFTLATPGPGSYRIRVQQIGYRQAVSPIEVSERDTVVSLRLTPAAVELSPVTVEATREEVILSRVGFYERKATGVGKFMDPEEVAKRAARSRQAIDVVDGVPGVTIVNDPDYWTVRRPQLRGRCSPVMYMDGLPMNSPGRDVFDLNGTLRPEEILALEVYQGPAEIPLHYGGATPICGIVLIWTKR